jgi:ABC-type Fe3+/spermidine/putrescine transport system ATPase subunit
VTLELRDLRKTYSGSPWPTVKGLSLTVPQGGLTALLGPSGSGKSTIMRMIAGLLPPEAGDIRLDGQSILHLPPDRRGVVMVFQNAPLFPHLSLAQNVGFGLKMRGAAPDRINAEVAAMLERVQLSGLGGRRPHELSGGQQQRGALARALVLKPRLLLLDEPLSSLDATLRDDMRGLIRSLQREMGITTLVVTHDQSEAVVLADRVALLLEGQLAQEATPDEIFRRPATVEVARFFGGVNFLPGHASGGVFDCALGRLELAQDAAEGPGTLTIRPEALQVGPAPGARPARVRGTCFLGTQTRVDLDVAGQPLAALVAPDVARNLVAGQDVTVSLPTDALWLVPGPPG